MSNVPSIKKHVEHTYTLKVNELNHDKIVNWLKLDESIATILVEYRDQFWVFNELNSEQGKVGLDALWECLYPERCEYDSEGVVVRNQSYRNWVRRTVNPELEAEGEEPQVVTYVAKNATKVMGRPKTDNFITLEYVSKNDTKSSSTYGGKREGAGRTKTDNFITTESAKMIAMRASGDKGRVVRRYFIAVEKILRALVKHNMLRVDIHQADEDYRIACISNGDAPAKAEGKMIELRGMTKAIIGARNDDQTCPKKYNEMHSNVAMLRRLGHSHKKVYEILGVPYECWWNGHKKKEDRS